MLHVVKVRVHVIARCQQHLRICAGQNKLLSLALLFMHATLAQRTMMSHASKQRHIMQTACMQASHLV